MIIGGTQHACREEDSDNDSDEQDDAEDDPRDERSLALAGGLTIASAVLVASIGWWVASRSTVLRVGALAVGRLPILLAVLLAVALLAIRRLTVLRGISALHIAALRICLPISRIARLERTRLLCRPRARLLVAERSRLLALPLCCLLIVSLLIVGVGRLGIPPVLAGRLFWRHTGLLGRNAVLALGAPSFVVL